MKGVGRRKGRGQKERKSEERVEEEEQRQEKHKRREAESCMKWKGKRWSDNIMFFSLHHVPNAA